MSQNCEECGWPQDACCCEPPAKTVKPYCGECGGSHEPSGARSDCVLHWKRRAVFAENEVLVKQIWGEPMLRWLLENLHLVEVNIDAGYCEEQKKPSAIFRSLQYTRGGRPWSAKGEQLERLKAAIHREMNHVHEWHVVARYPGGWQDACVTCGEHRNVEEAV